MTGGRLGREREEVSLVSVVDDDASVLGSLKNLLLSAGFHVETFGSAEAFLQSDSLARTRCLVLDLRMPGLSGADLLSHLVVTQSGIRVIILTADSDEDEREHLMRQGAVAFFSKPFRAADMIAAVRRALATA